jgi:hypothetical protein
MRDSTILLSALAATAAVALMDTLPGLAFALPAAVALLIHSRVQVPAKA